MQVTEPDVLRAIAHPLRRRLLDVLRVHGPQTASLLAQRLGSAVGNVSHHVRVLETSGLVEVAPELARDRRERWWRLVSTGLTWQDSEFADDPAADAVAQAAARLGLARQIDLTRTWLDSAAQDAQESPWRDAAASTDAWLLLSVEELALLTDELGALLGRFRNRPEDGTPRRPVFAFARAFPAEP